MEIENRFAKTHPGTQILFVLVVGLLLAAIVGVGYVYALNPAMPRLSTRA